MTHSVLPDKYARYFAKLCLGKTHGDMWLFFGGFSWKCNDTIVCSSISNTTYRNARMG